MKCPLITAGFFADPRASGMDAIDCLQEDCAWWDIDGHGCSIATLAKAVYFCHRDLIELRDKMPHAGQFTK